MTNARPAPIIKPTSLEALDCPRLPTINITIFLDQQLPYVEVGRTHDQRASVLSFSDVPSSVQASIYHVSSGIAFATSNKGLLTGCRNVASFES